MYSQRWPKRKLTKTDGERIQYDLDGELEAIETIKDLIDEVSNPKQPKQRAPRTVEYWYRGSTRVNPTEGNGKANQ